jgi:Domain of unknown function (DUF4115)
VGRHTSEPRPTAHRSATILKIAGAAITVCLVAVALYAVMSKHGSGSAAGKPAPPAALTIEVTGAQCLVFVRRPGGEVLVNQTLSSGQSVHFEGPPFDVVVGDATAVKVYVNGRLRPVSRTAFTVP